MTSVAGSRSRASRAPIAAGIALAGLVVLSAAWLTLWGPLIVAGVERQLFLWPLVLPLGAVGLCFLGVACILAIIEFRSRAERRMLALAVLTAVLDVIGPFALWFGPFGV